MRVLVIEDEQRLAVNVSRALNESAGYATDRAADGAEGLYLAQSNPYDLVILDLMLPKLSGQSLLKQLRDSGSKVPVLVLTARDDKETVVRVLNAGADDYVCKPFDLGELIARSKALIRRGKGEGAAIVRIGEVEINTSDRIVLVGGKTVNLTGMEYRVIEYLAHRHVALPVLFQTLNSTVQRD